MIEHLKKDPVMKKLIEKYGEIEKEWENDAFLCLARSIIFQQLGTKSAESIYKRFISLLKNPTPNKILKTEEETLRKIGLSRKSMPTMPKRQSRR